MNNPVFTPDQILWFALSHARPHGSAAIQALMGHLSALATAAAPCSIYRDGADNLWIDTRNGRESRTLFMAHLDTVATKPGTAVLWFNDSGDTIGTHGTAILGADDGAGIGILAAMLAANVPALFLFSQNEERGGDGGKHAAKHERERLATVDRCIAFDRRGRGDICGGQMVGTLASRAFVSALADALALGHSWGDGSYTDNSEFQGIVSEIVNVSVGYNSNHSLNETLDWSYFQDLRAAVLAVDWESLPTVGPDTSRDHVWDDWNDGGWSSSWGTRGGSAWRGHGANYPAALPLIADRETMAAASARACRELSRNDFPMRTRYENDRAEILTAAVWSLCDALALEPGTNAANNIRRELERFADALEEL